MNINNVIFTDNLPKLDLHGYDRETAIVAISDFIKDNIKLKNQIFIIVHGVGTGIIRKATHEYLKKHKKVIEYKTNYFNQGCTIVRISI